VEDGFGLLVCIPELDLLRSLLPLAAVPDAGLQVLLAVLQGEVADLLSLEARLQFFGNLFPLAQLSEQIHALVLELLLYLGV